MTAEPALMTVRARTLEAEPYISELVMQGRTQALRTVELRAQIDGRVEAVPADKGARVREGDVICRFAVEDRQARLDEARALAAQRSLELAAAEELAAGGHRSRTQVASARALHDAARAQVTQMEVLLTHTEIRAPFDGVIDQRPAEIGDYLVKGNSCATILDLDPYLIVAEVSERRVGGLAVGTPGRARLVDGTSVEGVIRYVSASAHPETRTYRIELEVANPEMNLRDGMTAELRIPMDERRAHAVPPSALVLGDDGRIGVRLVEDGTVRFRSVEIIGDDSRGLWVEGLEEGATLIVVGHQFVIDGERVRVHLENAPQRTGGATTHPLEVPAVAEGGPVVGPR